MARRTTSIRRLAAGLLAVLLMAGCGGEGADVSQTEDGQLVLGGAEEVEVTERGILPGTRALVFEGYNGSIRLQGVPGETARLSFTKRARGRDAEAARDLLGRVSVEESGDAEAYRYVMQASKEERTAVDVEGTVPQGTQVRIRLKSGDVLLSGIDGPIDVRNEGGAVRIGGAGERVAVETRNGAVEVGMQRVPAEAGLRLVTVNGDIRLTLPGDASAQVEAQTNAGSIQVEGLDFSSRRLDPQGAGARFTGRLGRGTAPVRMETENGTIILREGRVTALPDLPDEATPGTADTTAAPPAADTTAAAPRDTTVQTTPADTARARPRVI